jgi:hypothetical protein
MDKQDPSCTLLFEMEDTKATVKERAMLCKAVAEKIRFSNSVEVAAGESVPFSLSHIGLLEEHLRSSQDTKLVVINPLAAIMDAGMNDYRELEVRQVISRLEQVARKFNVAIVAVRHFGKRGLDQTRRGLDRVLGSVGLVAAVRSVLGIDSDGDRRYLVSLKNNLGKPPAAVAFRISDEGLTFEGEGPAYRSADEAPNPETRVDSCAAWLQTELSAGKPLPSKQLESRAAAAGYSLKTYRRAKSQPQFHTFQHWDGEKGSWFTELSAGSSAGDDAAAPPGEAEEEAA